MHFVFIIVINASNAINILSIATATTRGLAPLDILYSEVLLEPGESLVWETEPISEGWEQEILWF